MSAMDGDLSSQRLEAMLRAESYLNLRILAENVIRKSDPKKQDELIRRNLPIMAFLKDVISVPKKEQAPVVDLGRIERVLNRSGEQLTSASRKA